MGLGDLVNKGKDLFDKNKDKIDDAIKGDKAEDVSDKVLDAASDLAKKHVDEKHHDKIDSARDAADKAIGDK